MSNKPYNTGPFAPRVFDEVLNGEDIPPGLRLKLAAAMQRVDDTSASMFAVNQLADFVWVVAESYPIVPLIYLGVYDVDTDETISRAADAWDWDLGTTHFLVAGQHAEAGNRAHLDEGRLSSLFDSWGVNVKVLSQAAADHTPQQATWVADMVEQHDLSGIAIRAHPFHGARAFLTQLATLRKRGLDRKVVLMPWWNPYNPFGLRPLTSPWANELWSDVYLLSGEAKRIYDYSVKDDVATFEELQAYIEWLFQDSPVAEALQGGID